MPRPGEIWNRPGEGPTFKLPVLRITFPKPISGYWDGLRSGGEFTPDIGYRNPEPPKAGYIKWGDFSLNFWFTAKTGKTWKVAAANAMKHLKALTKMEGTTFETAWRNEEIRRY